MSASTPISAPAIGNAAAMDAKRMARGALSGWRGKLVEKVQRPIAQRTPLTVDRIRTIAGAIFLALAVRTVVRALRAGLR